MTESSVFYCSKCNLIFSYGIPVEHGKCPECNSACPSALFEIERLQKLFDDGEEATRQFNDGYTAAENGQSENDQPAYQVDHDEWRIGYAWQKYPTLRALVGELVPYAEIFVSGGGDVQDLADAEKIVSRAKEVMG